MKRIIRYSVSNFLLEFDKWLAYIINATMISLQFTHLSALQRFNLFIYILLLLHLQNKKKKKIKNKKNKYVPWYQGLEIDIKIWLKFSYCINYILDEKEPMFRMYYLGIIGER